MIQKYRRPYRIKKKKSILRNRFFWLGILTFVIFGSILYFLFFSQFFQIKEIIISGNEKALKENIREVAEGGIERKIIFISSKSIFLVDFNKIKQSVLNNFPHIAEIEITRRFPEALNLIVKERLGIAKFCQGEKCFLLDKEGVIFEEISENDLNLPKIQPPNFQNELALGKEVIEKELLSNILVIFSKLADLKISSKECLIVSDERINVKTLEGWEIYFNPKKNIDWQLTKLRAVLEKYLPPEKRENLEYIELRFGDRAFYK